MSEYQGVYYDIIDRASDIISSDFDDETCACRTKSLIFTLRQISDLNPDFIDRFERTMLYQCLDKSNPLALRMAYLKNVVITEKCFKDINIIDAVRNNSIADLKKKDILPPINYPVKNKQIIQQTSKINLSKLSAEIINHMKKSDKFTKFITNSWHFKPFESDVLGFTKNKKIHEFEIKTSKGDFKNDFKKACSSTGRKKHDLIQQGELADYFWFVIPSHLYQSVKENIPEYCGVISFVINHNHDILFVEEVIKASDLKKGF